MTGILTVLQLVIAVGIFNVWVLRFNKATAWRGGVARNMREEFAVYGLPPWSCGVVGFIKLLASGFLIAGVWIPELIKPAALVIAVLMLVAVAMHVKVSDPVVRAVPASIMFLMALCLIVN